MSKVKNATKSHRIWVQLDYSRDEKRNHETCLLANKMMRLLGIKRDCFWFNEERNCFNVTTDNSGCFLELSDNGHWFNLEFLAGTYQEATIPEAKP